MKIQNPFRDLSKFEWILWLISLTAITLSFIFAGDCSPTILLTSLIGATALIFIAKGHVIGQILTVVFSILYAVISFQMQYYGEMITFLGMTMPIAILSVIAWLKNPYQEGKPEVKVAQLGRRKFIIMLLFTALTTFGFYFILEYFNTANLAISTVSITTSFLASYLMLFRSQWYALAYAANDIVLIILWGLAAMEHFYYFPMTICFAMFFLNDLYGFYSWNKMRQKQKPCKSV